uniref:RNA-dependent RNA polymerase n=1 Tax=Crocidura lasiura ribovirus 4 TaxID=3139500 RepID=A0AB38ZJT8_9VIRU
MSKAIERATQLLTHFETMEDLNDKLALILDLQRTVLDENFPASAYAAVNIGYRIRHDLFLRCLAEYLEIPFSSDVGICYIENLLADATNINSKDLESHIAQTPDLAAVKEGVLYIIDAKVQSVSYSTAQETQKKYKEAFNCIARKYGVELKVLIVSLDPSVNRILTLPRDILKFQQDGTSVLLHKVQRECGEDIMTLTENAREIRDMYSNNVTYNRVQAHFSSQKYKDFRPWFDIPANCLDNMIKSHPSWKAMEERLGDRAKDLWEDIEFYNKLEKAGEDYQDTRTTKINERYRMDTEGYMNDFYNRLKIAVENPGKCDFAQPTNESLNEAFKIKESMLVNELETINTLNDAKPSQHFIWVPSEEKTGKLMVMKGQENIMKIARFTSAISNAPLMLKRESEHSITLQNGAANLLYSLSKSCDISNDIDNFTIFINDLKKSDVNKHMPFELRNGDVIKVSKNFSFKMHKGLEKEHVRAWAKIQKGYKKVKEMSQEEIDDLHEKKPKLLNITDECLLTRCEAKWNEMRSNLSREIDQNLASLHQYSHFHRKTQVESCNPISSKYIQRAMESTASCILKDITLLFKNMLVTAHLNSKDCYKLYFCKNVNICFVVLPNDSIMKAGSSIVYCCVCLVDYIEQYYVYNLDDSLAFSVQTKYIDPITDRVTSKWIVVSKPYRLDKTRLCQLFKAYENFILQVSIQSYLLSSSIAKDHTYTESDLENWYRETIALSYFSALNISKSVTSIVDPGRYMVNNSLADFSNNYQYIVEKFDPRPKTFYSLLLYIRLKEGCKRINAECSKVRMRKIQFREEDLLNVGIESCEIKAIYNKYLICAGISDVLIESQTFFYNCMKELHSQAQNMVKLYKVPLELELDYRKEYNERKEAGELYKYYERSVGTSITYDTFVGALVKNYSSFGDALLTLRKDIEVREGFFKNPNSIRTLSSSKSCVKHRQSKINIEMCEKLKNIIETEDKVDRMEALKEFNKRYKTNYRTDESDIGISLSRKDVDRHLVEHKVSDYLAVESTRVFDELCIILDKEFENIKKCLNKYVYKKIETVDDVKVYHLILWAVLNLDNDLFFTVFQKGQRTYNDREIYQGSYKNKLAMYFFEHIYKYFCSIHPEEMISEGGDRKTFKMNQIRKHDYRRMRDLRLNEIRKNREKHMEAIEKSLRLSTPSKEQSVATQMLETLEVGTSESARLSEIRKQLLEICRGEAKEVKSLPDHAKQQLAIHETTMRTNRYLRDVIGESYRKDYTYEDVEYIEPINLFEINADQSKWSAKDFTDKFIITVSLNPVLYPIEKKIIILFLLKYMRKKLILTDDTLATLMNFKMASYQTGEFDPFRILLKNYTRNYCYITQNWLQGNFNYSSSFIHATCMITYKDRLNVLERDDRYGCSYIHSTSLVHSDDNNTSILLQINRDSLLYKAFSKGLAGWILISIFRDTMEDFCVHLNDKKTFISRLIKEFISQTVVAGEQCPTWQRDILPILGNASFMSSMEDIYALSSHLQTAICHGAPPSIIEIGRGIIHSCVYSIYMQGYEMHNDPVKVFNVERQWLPMQLAGTLEVPSYILSLYGPASNDPWKLKNLINLILNKKAYMIENYSKLTDLMIKIDLLTQEDIDQLDQSQKFFLKFMTMFHPCHHIEEESEQDLEILDPDCLRPAVLIRPRSFVSGSYLSRFYTKHMFESMVSNNEIDQFILENPEVTFSKPMQNSIYSKWCAMKYKMVNFVQSLSLQSRSQLLVDKVIHCKSNLIRQSFIEDYLASQNYEVYMGENTMMEGHLTYNEAYEKIRSLTSNNQLNVETVKNVCRSVLLSNKFLQVLMEVDDNISYEYAVKNTSNYITKFRSIYHTQEIVNPPSKIIRSYLYPYKAIDKTEFRIEGYLRDELDFLSKYIDRTNYYKIYKSVFGETYYNTRNANIDNLRESLNELKKSYSEKNLAQIISKVNGQAFAYFLMYNYKSRLVIVKDFCPSPTRFIPILIGSNIKDNMFININLISNIVHKKNLEICTTVNLTPGLSYLVDVFYAYFNFVEACINPTCRHAIMQQTLPYLTYKNKNVCRGIIESDETILVSDKKLCMIFMAKYGIQLTENQTRYCESLFNSTRSINTEWFQAHMDRNNRIGEFDACYFTKNIRVLIKGINKTIKEFIVEINSKDYLDSSECQIVISNILKKVSYDLALDDKYYFTLPSPRFMKPYTLYLRRDRRHTLIISREYQIGELRGEMRPVVNVGYRFNEEINVPVYDLEDVHFIYKSESGAAWENEEDIKTIVKLKVGPRLKLSIKRKLYKKLSDAGFSTNIYFCTLNWNRFINCYTLLSCLDSGRHEINLTEIYRCITDLREEIQPDDKVCRIPFLDIHKHLFVDETAAFSYDTSELDVTDYTGSVTSIASVPFGIPIPFAGRIEANNIGLETFFRGLSITFRYAKINKPIYDSMVIRPQEDFLEPCAALCSSFDLLKTILSNGTRSGMYTIYYTCIYYCDRYGHYTQLKKRFLELTKKYGYTKLGTHFYEDDKLLERVKNKIYTYCIIDDNEVTENYRLILKAFADNIGIYTIQKLQYIEEIKRAQELDSEMIMDTEQL